MDLQNKQKKKKKRNVYTHGSNQHGRCMHPQQNIKLWLLGIHKLKNNSRNNLHLKPTKWQVSFFFPISFQSRVSPHMQSNAFSTKDIDALSLATLNNILISLSNQLVFHISVFAIHFFHIFSYLILACKYLTKGSLTVNFLSFLTNCCFFISLKMAWLHVNVLWNSE